MRFCIFILLIINVLIKNLYKPWFILKFLVYLIFSIKNILIILIVNLLNLHSIVLLPIIYFNNIPKASLTNICQFDIGFVFK